MCIYSYLLQKYGLFSDNQLLIKSFFTRPLSGKKILVTATEIIAEPLAEKIRKLGGEPVVMSLISVRAEKIYGLKEVLVRPGKRWLVFTSRNGLRFFFEQMKKEEIDIRSLGICRIA